jgi:hypothetical protein
MSHLSIERLAALADEQPTADEQSHLSRCSDCSREIEAHRSLLTMASSERESMGLPLTRWEHLSKALRADGLIVGKSRREERTFTSTLPTAHAWLRVAAALLLVAGGVALGRASTSEPVFPGLTSAPQTARGPLSNLDSVPTAFASVEEARRWKAYFAEGHQRVVSFLAANDSVRRPVETPAVMRARLSALDRVSRTMNEALNDAPFDPVINDFYLNSIGQREATLRQLNTVLPQNVRLNSF